MLFRSDEIKFLKRSFVWNSQQSRYVAPLALETVLEMANWVHGDVDHYELASLTLNDAMMELAIHPREVFDKYFPLFEQARRIVNEESPCVFSTYREYNEVQAQKCFV